MQTYAIRAVSVTMHSFEMLIRQIELCVILAHNRETKLFLTIEMIGLEGGAFL